LHKCACVAQIKSTQQNNVLRPRPCLRNARLVFELEYLCIVLDCSIECFSIHSMSNLHAIQQNGRGLSGIPDWVLQTSTLTRLSLRKNRIALLSQEIAQLPHLKCLDFSENQLVSLPPEIGLLTELQSVLLAFNHLTTLPRTFSLCVNVESLDLKGNKLTSIPFFFTRFVRLARLDMTNNVLQVHTLPLMLASTYFLS
jgi:Leucine-rich repeat (LRR) protein